MTRYLNLALLDTMADWEVGYLTAYTGRTEHQREPGAVTLRTVGLTAEPVRTVGGLTVVPDVTIDELRPDDSAMLVLPGADTWAEPEQRVWLDQARTFLDAGVPVAAICGATYALAAAGFLDHRPHTGPDRDFLASSGYAGTRALRRRARRDRRRPDHRQPGGAGRVRPRDLRPPRPLRARHAGVLVQAVRRPGRGWASTS